MVEIAIDTILLGSIEEIHTTIIAKLRFEVYSLAQLPYPTLFLDCIYLDYSKLRGIGRGVHSIDYLYTLNDIGRNST